MQHKTFNEALELILQSDRRYAREAYVFLRMALNFTIKTMKKPDQGPARHLSGRELLEGLRLYALQEFGPLSKTVLADWGITRTEDFGEIVFNLVGHGVLGKTDEDKKEDFAGGYAFAEAFTHPFLPASAKPSPKKNVTRKRSRLTSTKDKP
jgi:uncharacterized repeat protein (TIGR04138 family)